MLSATNRDIFEAIFGSGYFTYSWWRGEKYIRGETSDYFEPYGDWVMEIRVEDPEDEELTRRKQINADSIREACKKILDDESYRERLRRQCANLLYNPDDLDLDADDADVILQYVVFDGEIIYG